MERIKAWLALAGETLAAIDEGPTEVLARELAYVRARLDRLERREDQIPSNDL